MEKAASTVFVVKSKPAIKCVRKLDEEDEGTCSSRVKHQTLAGKEITVISPNMANFVLYSVFLCMYI